MALEEVLRREKEIVIKPKTWRLIETGIGSADWNMAVDEALLRNFGEGDLPILRLYGWEPSLSIGRFSNVRKCVDLVKLKRENLPYVRRITGGGVLVHGGDLSYALIMSRESLEHKGVKESYRYLCRFLIRLYEKLGQNALFACDAELETGHSDICLAGNEAYDIVIKGSKMGGNAQRYSHNLLFQHGSIPIHLDEARFKPFFLEDSGLERAATLERLGRLMTYERLSELLIKSFCEAFDANVVVDKLHLSEEQVARELLADKYSQEKWNIDAEHNNM